MIGLKLFAVCLGIALIVTPEKNKKSSPPGTVKITDGYYADATEVSNFSWLEYLYWLEKKHGKESAEYTSAFPDSSSWSNKLAPNCPNYRSYLKSPLFRSYPVIGVNKDQALAFCKWRTDRVNQFLYIKENKLTHDYASYDSLEYDFPKVFEYTLPTQNQWIELSQIPFSDKVLKRANKSGEKLGNFIDTQTDTSNIQPVYSYFPNEKGLYNVFGNVAELVAENSVVMGGSWKHSEVDCKLKQGQQQNNTNNWIGFRCIAYRVDTGATYNKK